jgi:hypothetical protein
VITAIDIVTDVLIALLPVMMTWSLNMPLKQKVYVFIAFSFRLPLIATAALHLYYFKEYPGSAEPQFAVTDSLLLQQVMITWSLISSTIPNMKGFMKSLDTSMSFPKGWGDTHAGSSSTSNSYALQSMTSTSGANNNRFPQDSSKSNLVLRPDLIEHSTTIYHTGRKRVDSTQDGYDGRNGSQELIIQKEVKWDVHHESL